LQEMASLVLCHGILLCLATEHIAFDFSGGN
jgi:hypothetical protein